MTWMFFLSRKGIKFNGEINLSMNMDGFAEVKAPLFYSGSPNSVNSEMTSSKSGRVN